MVNYRNCPSQVTHFIMQFYTLFFFFSLSFIGQEASIIQYFSESTSPALKFGSKFEAEHLHGLKCKASIKAQEAAALIGSINSFLSFEFNFRKMQAFYCG